MRIIFLLLLFLGWVNIEAQSMRKLSEYVLFDPIYTLIPDSLKGTDLVLLYDVEIDCEKKEIDSIFFLYDKDGFLKSESFGFINYYQYTEWGVKVKECYSNTFNNCYNIDVYWGNDYVIDSMHYYIDGEVDRLYFSFDVESNFKTYKMYSMENDSIVIYSKFIFEFSPLGELENYTIIKKSGQVNKCKFTINEYELTGHICKFNLNNYLYHKEFNENKYSIYSEENERVGALFVFPRTRKSSGR